MNVNDFFIFKILFLLSFFKIYISEVFVVQALENLWFEFFSIIYAEDATIF